VEAHIPMFVMKVLLAKTHVQVFVVASSGKPRHFAGAILCASRDRGAACADDPCEAVRAFFGQYTSATS